MEEGGGRTTRGAGNANALVLYATVSIVSFSVACVAYFSFSSPSPLSKRKSSNNRSARDESIDRLCGVLRELPEDEWNFVQAKLDSFLKLQTTPNGLLIKSAVQDCEQDDEEEEEEREIVTTSSTKEAVKSSAAVAAAITVTGEVSHIPPCAVVAPIQTNNQPDVSRFRTMLKVGVNPEAVKAKMLAEKMDLALVFGGEAAPSAVDNQQTEPGLERFRTMLKVGIHPQAVRNKMVAENFDPRLLMPDNDDDKRPVPEQKRTLPPPVAVAPLAPSCIFGSPIPPERLNHENSLWQLPAAAQQTTQISESIARKIQALFSATTKKRKKQLPRDENLPPREKHGNFKMTKKRSSPPSSPPPTTKKKSCLLPARRAQNLQIGFAKFNKLDSSAICQAVADLNATIFTKGRKDGEDSLQLLLRLLPTDEEMRMMRDAVSDEDASSLSDVERLFRLLAMSVPDCRQRVEWMIFHFKLPACLVDVQTEIDALVKACSLVLNNKQPLSGLLKIVLDVGVSLSKNTNGKIGGVSVFGLADKLQKTKTGDGRMTAADIVAGYARHIGLVLPALTLASQMSLPSFVFVENELRDLSRGADKRSKLTAGKGTDLFDAARVKGHIQALSSELEEVKQTYQTNILPFFGEPADRPVNLLLQDVFSLVTVVQHAMSLDKFQWEELIGENENEDEQLDEGEQ